MMRIEYMYGGMQTGAQPAVYMVGTVHGVSAHSAIAVIDFQFFRVR